MPAPARNLPPETLYEPRFPHPGLYLLPIILLPMAATLAGLVVHKLLPSVPEWIAPALAVSLSLLAAAKWMHDIHRIRSVLRTHGRFLCLNCHYALKGLPDSGTCPECDHPYQREVAERRWQTWEETINKGRPLA